MIGRSRRPSARFASLALALCALGATLVAGVASASAKPNPNIPPIRKTVKAYFHGQEKRDPKEYCSALSKVSISYLERTEAFSAGHPFTTCRAAASYSFATNPQNLDWKQIFHDIAHNHVFFTDSTHANIAVAGQQIPVVREHKRWLID